MRRCIVDRERRRCLECPATQGGAELPGHPSGVQGAEVAGALLEPSLSTELCAEDRHRARHLSRPVAGIGVIEFRTESLTGQHERARSRDPHVGVRVVGECRCSGEASSAQVSHERGMDRTSEPCRVMRQKRIDDGGGDTHHRDRPGAMGRPIVSTFVGDRCRKHKAAEGERSGEFRAAPAERNGRRSGERERAARHLERRFDATPDDPITARNCAVRDRGHDPYDRQRAGGNNGPVRGVGVVQRCAERE